jgi:hypothetical protein
MIDLHYIIIATVMLNSQAISSPEELCNWVAGFSLKQAQHIELAFSFQMGRAWKVEGKEEQGYLSWTIQGKGLLKKSIGMYTNSCDEFYNFGTWSVQM